jgi:hypothetical protein
MDNKVKVSLPKLDAKEVDYKATAGGNGSIPMKATTPLSQNFPESPISPSRRVSVPRVLKGGVPGSPTK